MTKKFPGLKDKRGPSQNIIILFKTAIGPLSSGMDAFRSLTLFLTVGQYYISLRRYRFCPLSPRDLKNYWTDFDEKKTTFDAPCRSFLDLLNKMCLTQKGDLGGKNRVISVIFLMVSVSIFFDRF